MLSYLLSFLRVGWPAISNAEAAAADSRSFPIKVDTSRLPEAFRKKFQLGDYRIDESDGDIRIKHFDMDPKNQQKMVDALRGEHRLFNFHGRKENIREFWAAYAKNNPDKTVLYLEVGARTYFFQELFERLMVIGGEGIQRDMRHGYRSPFGKFSETKTLLCRVNDDRNIREELRDSFKLSEYFRAGNVKIFIYHRAAHSLTSLYFDRHDDDVRAIDMRRAFFAGSKRVGFWVMGGATGAFVGGTAIGAVPIMGSVVSCATVFATSMAFYRAYQLFCPAAAREKISTFVREKIEVGAPRFGVALRVLEAFSPKNKDIPSR
ncbi:MAG: hypothetical protein LBG09_00100 [Puniceicoccales bacterium]|jgi:hypothetical protein|nr:hypothetical protein [Puniceicoccales bacterium]